RVLFRSPVCDRKRVGGPVEPRQPRRTDRRNVRAPRSPTPPVRVGRLDVSRASPSSSPNRRCSGLRETGRTPTEGPEGWEPTPRLVVGGGGPGSVGGAVDD